MFVTSFWSPVVCGVQDRMKRRRRQTEEDLEYLEKRPKSVQRRKANPELRMADLLERVINTIATTQEVGGGGGGGGGASKVYFTSYLPFIHTYMYICVECKRQIL